MNMRAMPIRRKLTLIILLTSIVVMLLMRGAFFTYEYFVFRQAMTQQVDIVGQILASNSTAALAFENPDDAREILSALRVERHVVAAAVYHADGRLFAHYPETISFAELSGRSGPDGTRFEEAALVSYQPVTQNGRRLGTLYLKVAP